LAPTVTGNDVLYQTLKSIRTAFVIGTLATLATLPLAVVLGILAGYLKGWVDEAIQYLYTTLSSMPNVLLIAACVLMVQVFIDKHPECSRPGRAGRPEAVPAVRRPRPDRLGRPVPPAARRDAEAARTGLRAGRAGLRRRPTRIMARHILPNVMHLMLIVAVLEFSGAGPVRGRAVLRGRGRRPEHEQLRRHDQHGAQRDEPRPGGLVVASRRLRVHGGLVLAANLFADGVRDAFDPRARVFRPRVRGAARAGGPAVIDIGSRRSAWTATPVWCAPSTACACRSSAARPSRWWANRAAARA
jgi:peptide/nickel transport system permease protein